MAVASLWIGDALGPIEVASIKSFLRNDNEFILYSYQPVRNVPDGVIVRDAKEILETTKILRHHKTGSPALHSDLFRYALLRKTDYYWVDLDIIAFRKFEDSVQWAFAPESPNFINGAVLRLPRDSKTLDLLSQYNESTRGISPVLKGIARLRSRVKNFIYRCFGVDRYRIEFWRWGSLGPIAITRFLNETGEISHALPTDSFYHVHYKQVERFLIPGELTQSEFTDEAWGVHLWGKELRALINGKYKGKVPEGCYLDYLIKLP